MVRLTPTRLVSAVALASIFALFTHLSSRLWGTRGYDLVTDALSVPARSRARPSTPAPVRLGEECSPFSTIARNDATIVLKIGAGEVAKALPAYIDRLGRCSLPLLVFSDRAAEYQGLPIVDALANLRPEYKYQNPDFEIYDRIQAENGTVEVQEGKTDEGWRLDKYKFLPMMELAAHYRPESSWYIFVELDTYVNWDNMYRFLTRFDPLRPHYFGSPVWPRKTPTFAHGGSGFVISRGAMNKLVARGRMFAENHDFPGTHLFGKQVSKVCCGDEVLGQVLKECGVPLRGYWPMFNGEAPSTIRFNWEHWCEAIITLHHVQNDAHESLKTWESKRENPAIPLTFAELFSSYIEPELRDRRDDWTNMSEDITLNTPGSSAKSFASCRAACARDKKCVQFEVFGSTCRLGHSIRLGHAQNAEAALMWTSGWMLDRIGDFKEYHSRCGGAHFVHPNP